MTGSQPSGRVVDVGSAGASPILLDEAVRDAQPGDRLVLHAGRHVLSPGPLPDYLVMTGGTSQLTLDGSAEPADVVLEAEVDSACSIKLEGMRLNSARVVVNHPAAKLALDGVEVVGGSTIFSINQGALDVRRTSFSGTSEPIDLVEATCRVADSTFADGGGPQVRGVRSQVTILDSKFAWIDRGTDKLWGFGWPCIWIEDGSIEAHRVHFKGGPAGGIAGSSGSTLVVEDCTFIDTLHGVRLRPDGRSGASVRIVRNRFVRCRLGGVVLTGATGGEVSANQFSDSNLYATASPRLILDRNVFEGRSLDHSTFAWGGVDRPAGRAPGPKGSRTRDDPAPTVGPPEPTALAQATVSPPPALVSVGVGLGVPAPVTPGRAALGLLPPADDLPDLDWTEARSALFLAAWATEIWVVLQNLDRTMHALEQLPLLGALFSLPFTDWLVLAVLVGSLPWITLRIAAAAEGSARRAGLLRNPSFGETAGDGTRLDDRRGPRRTREWVRTLSRVAWTKVLFIVLAILIGIFAWAPGEHIIGPFEIR